MTPIVEQHPDVREPEQLAPTELEADPVHDRPADEMLDEDLLVEEVSIDGMCGVY